MEAFISKQPGRSFVLRLDQGDLILESIEKLIEEEKIQNGVVVSGIGTVDASVLHMVTSTGYPPVEFFDRKENEAIEVVSIQGFIADGAPHLHMMISDRDAALGGHLEHGCKTLYLAEIVITEYPDLSLKRVPDERGINKLTSK